ncbi:MAG TPA: condensation domain-containing protein, partial [Ktedonobacteraceae bacterium]
MTTRFSAESSLQVNEQVFVASLVQQNSWILDQLEDGSSLNTLSTSAQVRGTLSAELLQRCLDQLVQRHDILRTTLRVQEGQLVQVIAPDLHVPVSVHNLQTLSPQQLQARVSFLTSQQSQPPFDLQQGPLLRCSLLRLPEECSLLVLSAHRAICDDWSLALLMRELANQIEAGVAEQSVPTFSQTVPYAQVALDQQGMSQEERAAHLDYWRHHLDGAPTTLPLPIDYPRPAVAGVQAAHVDGLLSPAEGQRVQALAQQYSVEPTEIWLAAFVILLARSSAQDDLVLGVQTPGRDVTQQEQIGPYASLLLVRPDLSDDPEVGTLVQRVQGLLQAHRAHEALPFETILKAVHPTRVQSQHPLFQVVLALPWNRPPLPPGWTFREDDPTHETTQYDLQLELRETTHGLTSRFTYRRDLFAERTIQRMSAHW